MKIGCLIYDSINGFSGAIRYDRKLIEFLRSRGDQVEIISLPSRKYPVQLLDNFSFRLPAGLDVLIEDEDCHASLLNVNKLNHPYPFISLVHHLRSSEDYTTWQRNIYRRVENQYLQSVDGYIFNSNTTRGVVQDLVGQAVPWMVALPPTDRFGSALSAGFSAARAHEAGAIRLVFLGNVIPRKELHTVLDALPLLITEFHLDVIGSLSMDAHYAVAMQRKVRELGLTEYVTFHGTQQTDDLIQILTPAHVMVLPSSYEGFGVVYLEGMRFGMPAIGGTIGAAGEVIQEGQTGYLVEPGDARTLAERINTLAGDRDLLTEFSLRALERYSQQPKWDETAENIRQFLVSFV